MHPLARAQIDHRVTRATCGVPQWSMKSVMKRLSQEAGILMTLPPQILSLSFMYNQSFKEVTQSHWIWYCFPVSKIFFIESKDKAPASPPRVTGLPSSAKAKPASSYGPMVPSEKDLVSWLQSSNQTWTSMFSLCFFCVPVTCDMNLRRGRRVGHTMRLCGWSTRLRSLKRFVSCMGAKGCRPAMVDPWLVVNQVSLEWAEMNNDLILADFHQIMISLIFALVNFIVHPHHWYTTIYIYECMDFTYWIKCNIYT